ncbi:MAG: hypothetical protein H6737_06350 [Alphaproteobacteria bacterium]|nr:hypothetical protein [Alphaproteobacteria bacterium]
MYADLFTEAFFLTRRRKFRSHKAYSVSRMAPHLGGVEASGFLPEDVERRVRLYRGPDPSGPLPAARRWVGRAFRLLPLRDDLRTWPDLATADAALRRRFGDLRSPTVETDPDDPLALARLVTEGFGAHRLVAWDGGYAVDLRWLSALPVRPGFAPYGAALHVSRDLDAVQIEVDGVTLAPGDAGFGAARDRFEASLLLVVTVVDHLIHMHLDRAGGLVLALREGLPADHALRTALMPFTFNVARMNQAALDLLHGARGYFHRCFALDVAGLETLVRHALANPPPCTPPAERAPGPDLPFFVEAQGWWEALERYVVAVVDATLEAREEAALADALGTSGREGIVRVLTARLFDGTVGHRQVGNVGGYVQDAAWMPTWTRPGRREDSLLAIRPVIQKTVLSFISTRVRAPRFTDDVGPVLPEGPIRDAWVRLDADLTAWEAGLDARNALRPRPYDALRRADVATSAAV